MDLNEALDFVIKWIDEDITTLSETIEFDNEYEKVDKLQDTLDTLEGFKKRSWWSSDVIQAVLAACKHIRESIQRNHENDAWVAPRYYSRSPDTVSKAYRYMVYLEDEAQSATDYFDH